MFNPSSEYSPSRPFKIFISLLDKFEIGSLLTEALVFDAFRALKQGIESGADPGEEVGELISVPLLVLITGQMSLTATTLYEAVEPHALWKQLLKVVFSDLSADDEHLEVLTGLSKLLKAIYDTSYRAFAWSYIFSLRSMSMTRR